MQQTILNKYDNKIQKPKVTIINKLKNQKIELLKLLHETSNKIKEINKNILRIENGDKK